MRYGKFILIALILVSAALHLWRLGIPSKPVFDEAHFATYALDYAKGIAHTDIHPPLGKILYAGLLFLSGRDLSQTNGFLNISKNPQTNQLTFSGADVFYGDYPYLLLRSLSVLSGLILILLIYIFAKTIGLSKSSALFASTLIALDNALLLDTRLILLNGMYLSLGLLSLILFFKKTVPVWLVGLIWGLCLSVKLLGILFLGPIFLTLIKSDSIRRRRVIWFISIGLVTLLMSFCLNWLFFSPQSQVRAWQDLGIFKDLSVSGTVSKPYIFTWLMYPFIDIAGYTVASSAALAYPVTVSNWYEWPIMQKPMALFWQPDSGLSNTIFLTGNLAVWLTALFAVFIGLLSLIPKIKNRLLLSTDTGITATLLSGYFFALLPFIFISRTSFLYHYYPALLFGIILAGHWLGKIFDGLKKLRQKTIFLTAFVLILIAGFAWSAPLIYGFRPWFGN